MQVASMAPKAENASIQTDVVIIGGGMAGLWSALELSRRGVKSLIVDRDEQLGGQVKNYVCKATDRCQRCGACLLEDTLEKASAAANVSVMLESELDDVREQDGTFELRFTRPSGNPDGPFSVSARAVELSCGFAPFDPGNKPRFGYGRVQGVFTGLELEARLRSGGFNMGEGEGAGLSVAFIQCVGSRDPKIGRNYCSRVCCGYAMRLARLVRHRLPQADATMFYMDIQTFDRDFDRRLEQAAKEVRLVRAIPSEIRAGEDGRPQAVYYGPDEERVAESFDMVILSVGMSPNPEAERLARLFGLGLNQDGFLDNSAGSGGPKQGVFVAGAAQGPRSIDETVAHAVGVAGDVADYLAATCSGGAA